MAKNEVRKGAILSYILIVVNALYGFLLTPFILQQLGEGEYGVYKTIASFTASLMVLDLGIGGTLMRYIARFRADQEDEKIPHFIAMELVQASIICAIVGIILYGLHFSLDSLFSGGLTSAELIKAKQLYTLLAVGVIAHICENVINGIITGYNRFTFGNGIKLFRLLARAALIVAFLSHFQSAVFLAILDLFLTVVCLVAEVIYVLFNIHVKPRLRKWDWPLFAESFKYTAMMLITTVAVQVNNNLDNIIIGALVSASAVTVYSMGLLIFGMFEQLSTAISGVMLPTVTMTLKKDTASKENTLALIVGVGRIQFILLGAAVIGFSVLGRAFIQVWLGDGFGDVYALTLILIIPALFELCVNTCLSVLRAENRLGFRTTVLLITTLLNAAISVIGTHFFGYFAAAVGTAFSFLFGSVIIMGIYYKKAFGFPMLRIYREIFRRVWLCLLCAGIGTLLASCFLTSPILKLVVGILVFLVLYGITLLIYGLSKEEKNRFLPFKLSK